MKKGQTGDGRQSGGSIPSQRRLLPARTWADTARARFAMTDEPVSDLLAGLASSDPGPAWTEFLRRYSATILQVVRRYDTDPERANDCFQRVCEALSDRGFQRLLSYRQDSPARFRTWLKAVTANLCIDWRRKRRGRFRPIRAVARLPEREQLVYRCLYVRGLSRVECLRVLGPRFPDLTVHEIADINARLFSLLTPRQRWQLGARTASTGPQGDEMTLGFDDAALQLEEPRAGAGRTLPVGAGSLPARRGTGRADRTRKAAPAIALRAGPDPRRGREAHGPAGPLPCQSADPGGTGDAGHTAE